MTKEILKFIKAMPKIELHVHLEGSVQPETLLTLAEKNGISLPATTLEDVRNWYVFTDFDNFVEVYLKISECIRSPEDIEIIAREFLSNQKKQNILYTEFTYTPYTHYTQKGLAFSEQLAALERARNWGLKELGIDCRFIMDINRMIESEEGTVTAKWLMDHEESSIVALGLGGAEYGYPPERHKAAFDLIEGSRFHSAPHAGEMDGPRSVRNALKLLRAERLGHGVRSWEDPDLISFLVKNKIPLEVCPSSNVCLNIYDSIEDHILPKLVDAGLTVTINSDDPPMFNTTLTKEYIKLCRSFGYGKEEFLQFNLNSVNSSFLPPKEKEELKKRFLSEWKIAESESQ